MKIQTSTKFILALSAALTFCVWSEADTFEKTYRFDYNANEAQQLQVSIRDADVEIIGDATASSTSIEVIHKAKTGSQAEADRFFERESIASGAENGIIVIENAVKNSGWNMERIHGSCNTKISVTCPYQMAGSIRSSDGDISATNLKGDLTIRSSDGDLHTIKIVGNLDAATSDGDIIIDGLQGDVDARTSDGDILINHLAGAFSTQTSDGDIQVTLESDPTANSTMRTSDGDISLSIASPKSLTIKARVSDGEIENRFSAGTVTHRDRSSQTIVVGSGDIEIQIRTTDGDINIGS